MSSNSPCAACKCLRRKCTQECVFAPYFPPDNPQKFTNVHKVFGASNVSKLLNELSAAQREDAVNSLAYEAEHRLRDPIYGCVGFISVLQQRLSQVHANLENAKKELASYIGPSGMAPMLNHRGFVQQHGPQQAYQLIPQNVQPMMGMQLVLRDQQHQQQQLLICEQDQHQHHHQQQQQQLMMREQAPPQQHLVAQQQYLEAQQMAREQEMMQQQQQQHHNRSNDLMRFNSEGGGGGGAVTATGLNHISSGGSGGGGVAMQQQPSLTLGSSYEASHQQFQHQEQHEHEYEHGQLHPLHQLQLQQLQEYIEAQQDNERRMQKGKGKADPCIGPSC
ncbi:LOB domain-containing protein 36-like [Salvia hispanica]|uniref:LOB domain-containing protein 36-like n=1 Tax=Salvia hispanica TaxID=49212 RepID=UPI002009B1BA|nr:LOB domain-containing protein 36-like [Salvia hispanica]